MDPARRDRIKVLFVIYWKLGWILGVKEPLLSFGTVFPNLW
jgi:hypothetical protein